MRLCLCLLVGSLLAGPLACGPREAAPPPRVVQETPADEILRIGERWVANTKQRGLLSPPSPVSVFAVLEESRLTLTRDQAREELVVEEQFELRDGGTVLCVTRSERTVGLKWGRREGEAAIELRRPALSTPRQCEGGRPPEPLLERPAGAARYVLRSDSLVAVEPPLEDRVYIPLP